MNTKNNKNKLLLIITAVVCTFGIIIIILMSENKKSWTVTSYASVTGAQSMIYTIVDNKGRLMIVDGGFEEDADQVRKIIHAHNDHVYAWIITHPHPDHAGAFNVIMSENSEIVVDDIYVTDLDYERYKITARSYDGFETCEKYYAIVNNLGNVHVIGEGDSFECLGLQLDVIHGWDEEVNALEANLCNNGSLVFLVKGKESKMLFCSDLLIDMEEKVITRHAQELADVNYIQAGHHGNWGLSVKFYDTIENPISVFFDSGDDLLTPGDYGFDAGKLKEYFEGRGAKVMNYSTAPNSIIIR